MFNFEKLQTWQQAITFADLVYRLTRSFPVAERFGLTAQMRRAAVSISSNIAEGCSRSSRTDYAKFLEIATGSLYETLSQATISRNQGLLDEAQYQQIDEAAEQQSRMLTGLRKSLGIPCRHSTTVSQLSTASSTWFWVEAPTWRSAARWVRKALTSAAPISRGCLRPFQTMNRRIKST